MFGKIITVLASGIALAAACTTPGTQLVNTNPIYLPDTTHSATAGQPFTITWDGSNLGSTVTLILLRGPSTNIVPLYPIVQGTANTGSYVWTPATDLPDDVTHYGIQLIDDDTCHFQWSTQFGISNSGYGGSSSPAAPPSSSPVSYPSSQPTKPASSVSLPPKSYSTSYSESRGSSASLPTASPSIKYNTTATSYAEPTVHTSTTSTPAATFKPVQTNDAGRFAMSMGGAVVAFAAAIAMA